MNRCVKLIMRMSVLLTVTVGNFLSKDQMSSESITTNQRQLGKNSQRMDGLKPEIQQRLTMEYFESWAGPVQTSSRVVDTKYLLLT